MQTPVKMMYLIIGSLEPGHGEPQTTVVVRRVTVMRVRVWELLAIALIQYCHAEDLTNEVA